MQATEDVKLPYRKLLAKLFHKLTTDLMRKFRGQIKNTLPS